MSRRNKVGIIAEDNSDVSTLRVLINRIIGHNGTGIKGFAGGGCGMLKRKCRVWADNLRTNGCNKLIIVHDLDRNNIKELTTKIEALLDPSPIKAYCICIPIEELEAWLLSDSNAIRKLFNLPKPLKNIANPERLQSPKEHLYDLVDRTSNGTRYYIHTKHNEQISSIMDLKIVRQKCRSFSLFYDFVYQECR